MYRRLWVTIVTLLVLVNLFTLWKWNSDDQAWAQAYNNLMSDTTKLYTANKELAAANKELTTRVELYKQTTKEQNLLISDLHVKQGPSPEEYFYQGAYAVCRLAQQRVEFCIKATQTFVKQQVYEFAQTVLPKENWNWAIISGAQ